MRGAIRVEFPNESHRLCLWHLHQNDIENVKSTKFLQEFKSLVYANYIPKTFEDKCKGLLMIIVYHNYFKKTYNIKTMWSSEYMRDITSEGINSFIQE